MVEVMLRRLTTNLIKVIIYLFLQIELQTKNNKTKTIAVLHTTYVFIIKTEVILDVYWRVSLYFTFDDKATSLYESSLLSGLECTKSNSNLKKKLDHLNVKIYNLL